MARKKAPRPSVESELAELARATSDLGSAQALTRLSAALANGPSLVAARAASLVRQHRTLALAKELKAAFARFLRDPGKDPGCHAKLAIVEALDALDEMDEEPFLAAARCVQREPAWGPPVDTAVGVRARGVLALARAAHSDLVLLAAELLGDPEPPVRQAAADALACYGARDGAGAALVKLRAGDADPLVTMACLTTVLALAPDWGLRVARAMLGGDDESAREVAALALGQSPREDALALLVECLEVGGLVAERALLLRAVGLHRSERARALLLERVADGSPTDARSAVAALAPQRFEPGLEQRAREAAALNVGVDLADALAKAFTTR